MTQFTQDEPIPSPTGFPLLGNLPQINPSSSLESFLQFAELYGPIFRLNLGGQNVVAIGSQALMKEVTDETRFVKAVKGTPLEELRNGISDGLFTAIGSGEKNWGIAHRVLMPAFGPLSIQKMFPEMHDIATQLVMKWARHGPDYLIPVTDDFTRLTLDTLGLCAMDFRFNSFYQEKMHAFPEAMTEFLLESGQRSFRPSIANFLFQERTRSYNANIALMKSISDEVIRSRRHGNSDRKDLLAAMLNGKDPQTGESMSDENITANLITFLIAGHETTSGTLSYVFYYLLKNPEAYRKAQEEVDKTFAQGSVTVTDLPKLTYITAVLQETLRLQPPAPFIAVKAKKDDFICDKYRVSEDEPIFAILSKVQKDPAVFGENASEFKPERFLDGKFEELNREYPGCWKPFGSGMRACIGKPFAWQEMLLVVAMLLQQFNFSMADPSYDLATKQTLTIKPDGFLMRASLRNSSATKVQRLLHSDLEPSSIARPKKNFESHEISTRPMKDKPLSIIFGSNTGTCEALANRLAQNATKRGLSVDIRVLDNAVNDLPDGPLAIFASSYEGQPPDNGKHFLNWLEKLQSHKFEKTSYLVFGCGHHDWCHTLFKVPKEIDALMERAGCQRMRPLGTTDVASGNCFNDFDAWEEQSFWPALELYYRTSSQIIGNDTFPKIDVKISSLRVSTLKQSVQGARVSSSYALSPPSQGEKRHLEIQLPPDMTYTAGDYLAILPRNPSHNIRRAIRYFGLNSDTTLKLASATHTMLPTDIPVSVMDIFGSYIELAQPASRKDLKILSEYAQNEEEKVEVQQLSQDTYDDQVLEKGLCVLDLLDIFPSIHLPLGNFLQMMPPMRVRQYSISSSPLWSPSSVTLTYSVLRRPALSGRGTHVGVASSYLSSLAKNDFVQVAVKKSHQSFHLPLDIGNVPIILIAAGTGLAPFRGFVQERALQIQAGRHLAPAMLFFGCRSRNDDLYREEFDTWQNLGAVEIKRAYSRDAERTFGCKYVQERLWKEREDVYKLWKNGGKCFVCGNREIGNAVQSVAIKMMAEGEKNKGVDIDEKAAKLWFESIKNDRFVTDIFS